MTATELIGRLTGIVEEQAGIIDELAEMLLQYEAVEKLDGEVRAAAEKRRNILGGK